MRLTEKEKTEIKGICEEKVEGYYAHISVRKHVEE